MVTRVAKTVVLATVVSLVHFAGAAAASPTLLGSVAIGSNTVVQLAVNPATDRLYAAGPFAQPGLEVVNASVATAPVLSTTIATAAGGVAVDPATGRFFASDGYGDQIVTYDGATNAAIHSTAETGCGGLLAFDATRNVVDQVTQCADSLNVMSASTLSLVGSRALGGVGGWVSVNPATGDAYAVRNYNATVVFGPPPALGVVATLPGTVTAVNPVTNRVYGWPGSGSALTVYDGATNSAIGTVAGGNGTSGVPNYDAGVDTVSDRIYEINADMSDLLLIDGATNTVTGTLTLPGAQRVAAITVDSAKHRVYVVGGTFNGPKTLFVYGDAPPTFADRVTADHPGWWWRLGEGAGSTMTAAAGGQTGNYQNGVALGQAGAVGDGTTSALFNGTSSYAYVNGVAAPTQAYTMEIWMKATAPLQGGTLLDQGGAGALYIATDRFCFRQTQTPICWPQAPAAGAWYHVVGTWDASSKIARLYVNGVLRASGPAPSPPSGSGTLYVGYGQSAPWFKGYLDEPLYYPTALSAARVAAHYHAGCGC